VTALIAALHHPALDAALLLGGVGATLTALSIIWSRP
jgi:hypothetical protein